MDTMIDTMGGYVVKTNGNGISCLHFTPKRVLVGYNKPDPSLRNSLGIIVTIPEELGEHELMEEIKSLNNRLFSSPTALFEDIKGTEVQRRRAYKDFYRRVGFESGRGASRMVYSTGGVSNDPLIGRKFNIPFAILTGSSKQDGIVYEDGVPYAVLMEHDGMVKTVRKPAIIEIFQASLEKSIQAPLEILEIKFNVWGYSGGEAKRESVLLKLGSAIGLNRKQSGESLDSLL